MLRNVMMDLETWGLRSGCALRSIGARMFDPFSSGKGAGFYVNVEKQSCIDAGLHVDPDTEAWWADQSQEAREALEVDPRPLREALEMYVDFFVKNNGMFTWSQGANYDQPIIAAAFHAVGIKEKNLPWKFFNSRCTRTVYGIAGFNPFSVKRSGTHHNALADCDHQIICVQRAMVKAGLAEKELLP